MTQLFKIHPENPQKRLVEQAAKMLHSGAVIAYPTDSGYALGAALGDKNAYARIHQIRNLDKHHHMTLMMDFRHIGEYARVDNAAFRLLKKSLPGPYTFILEATKIVPNRLMHPKRKTVGIRVCAHPFVREMIKILAEPMMSVSLILPGLEFFDAEGVASACAEKLDLIIDSGRCPPEPTTVVDLSGDHLKIIREGGGDISPFL